MGRDAGSSISDASSRRGRPEAAQSIVDDAIDEWRKRLHAYVDEKGSQLNTCCHI